MSLIALMRNPLTNATVSLVLLRRPQARFLATFALLAAILAPVCSGQDWTRFRGPDATGVSADDSRLPIQWNQQDNTQWSVDVPGQGWGSPIVVGKRVFLSTVIADEENTPPQKGLYLGQGVRDPGKGVHHWMVYCFDIDSGKQLWKHEAHTGRPTVPRHPKSSYAAETPTTDGQRLYVLFGDLGLYCYSLEGELLWQQDIAPKKTNLDYGAAASPVICDGQVIMVYDNLESSWIAAFDTETGQERWRTKRDETHSWATPFVWKHDQRTEIVVPGRVENRSYSPQGELLWHFKGRMSVLVIPSPFAAHGMCYVASGYVGDFHRPTFAILPGGSGDIAPSGEFAENEFIQWYQPKASPYNTTQIVYGDNLYTIYDQGIITCHHAKTGEEVYGKRRISPRGSFTASPWAYNGYLFCLSEDGLTYVIKAGDEYELVHTNPLEELCIATPSVSDGKLLVRTLTKLYCISGNDPVKSTGTKLTSQDLIDACIQGNLKLATACLEADVDVNSREPQGSTVLHVAAFFGHQEIVELLIQQQADRTALNQNQQTALQVVSQPWNQQLEQTYTRLANILSLELDMERLQKSREEIAAILRKAQQ
ncbi:outer membrane biogenesis protein BamB [Stieleria bergensis]|uniref:Outer membrane biogenesis protein BamB n=1 Tax=Stieleria bergensis TaxID=2528025 RepID=A0A517SQY3_9BACT|nr:outer membrane biogenesis protein BamB [Planctomycetes bacterium SV_7m_r]